MVAGVLGKLAPVSGTEWLPKGTGCATAPLVSVVVAATTDTAALPAVVLVSTVATGRGAGMGGCRAVVWLVLSESWNVGERATKCWGLTWFSA